MREEEVEEGREVFEIGSGKRSGGDAVKRETR